MRAVAVATVFDDSAVDANELALAAKGEAMKISIITSCTGQKTVLVPNQLIQEDFAQGESHVRTREWELAAYMRPAGMLYAGEQHVRLMRGVQAAREQGAKVCTSILSAGYGVVEEGRLIAPYEMTFNTMKKKESHAWATMLGIQESVREVLDAPLDMTLMLLGDRYLQACEFDSVTQLHSPTWALCGKGSVKRFSPAFQPVRLKQSHAGQFGAAMTNLKGSIAARLLENVCLGPAEVIRQAFVQPLALAHAELLF